MIDRCCDYFLVVFESAFASRRNATLADCIRAIIDVTLILHHLAPELHRVVLDLAPRIGVADKAEMVSRTAAKAIESMLREHSDEIAPEILAHPVHAHDDTLAQKATRLITRCLAISESPFAGMLNCIDQGRRRMLASRTYSVRG